MDLISGDGEKITGFLAKSGWQVAEQRAKRMGETDLQRQLWFIDASFASVAKVERSGLGWGEESERIRADDFLAAMLAAGRQIRDSAICFESQSASWLSLRFKLDRGLHDVGHYQLGVLEDDLYSGLSGLALYLAYLGAFSGKSEFRELSKQALATLQMRWRTSECQHMGAYSGIGGFIYLLTHLARLWQKPELVGRDAVNLLDALESLIPEDRNLDWISGSAGCIPPLLELWRQTGNDKALELALACGDRILESSVFDGAKGERSVPGLEIKRGLSHGHSGLALGLWQLGPAVGDEKWTMGALQLLKHERALLDNGDWTDIPERRSQATWCHGAPGIALARMAMLQLRGNPQIEDDVRFALAEVLRAEANQPLMHQILCHGSLGNLETLVLAAEVFPEEKVFAKVRDERAAEILSDVNRNGWHSPLPEKVIEIGLLKGLAGIGYGFFALG